MYKLVATLIAVSSIMIPPLTIASGGHDGGHGQTESTGKQTGDGHGKMENKHGHSEEKSPVGSPADSERANTWVSVRLSDDMRINFNKEFSSIKSGTIIQFRITNTGSIPHEFAIGNQEEQKEHAAMMRNMPGMVHSDGNTVTVEPGNTKFLTWNFDGDDMVVFSCNIPGHYEAGMFKKIELTPLY